MTPTVDERLASVVRALTEVILPHLPPEASLAQEQTQLAIGHIQIIRAQLDAAPAFEREELADAVALGEALAADHAGAAGDLRAALGVADGTDVRSQRQSIHKAIDALVGTVAAAGDAGASARLSATILEHEQGRALKDRRWCAPFGFDTL
jgi:hypothetical protein